MQPPKLMKIPKKHKFHSQEIEDDWHYLEDNWQKIVKDPKKLPKKIWRCLNHNLNSHY